MVKLKKTLLRRGLILTKDLGKDQVLFYRTNLGERFAVIHTRT